MLNRPKPLVLLILNGFGYSVEKEYNAMAKTPCWDKLQSDYLMTLLNCSGSALGLPDDQMGNSEVGHMHIGLGRYVPQDFFKVNNAIKNSSLFDNEVFLKAVRLAKEKGKAQHILGLLSPGGVHSHENQIMTMLELATKNGLDKIYVHTFLDGRDVPPQSAASFIKLMESKINDVIICNYANCDMVGHTGIISAAIAAVEAVDNLLQRILDALRTVGGRMLLTADHGNIEQMLDKKTGQPHTTHAAKQVPLVYVCGDKPLASGGSLSDVAPTMLDILGIEKPREMTGRSLIAPI